MGPQPTIGILQLEAGEERSLVSRAILEALQLLRHSIVDPELSLDELLPAKEKWETDLVPLEAAEIAAYNRAAAGSRLPDDRLLGVVYSGRYEVEDKELRFELSAVLYQRGLKGKYRKYREPYDSAFFLARAEEGIRERLRALAAENPE